MPRSKSGAINFHDTSQFWKPNTKSGSLLLLLYFQKCQLVNWISAESLCIAWVALGCILERLLWHCGTKVTPPWPQRSGAHTFRRRFTLRHKLASMQKKTHYTPSLLENSRGVQHLLPWKYPGALEISRTWKKPGLLEFSRAPGKIQVSWKFPGGDLISHWTSSATIWHQNFSFDPKNYWNFTVDWFNRWHHTSKSLFDTSQTYF